MRLERTTGASNSGNRSGRRPDAPLRSRRPGATSRDLARTAPIRHDRSDRIARRPRPVNRSSRVPLARSIRLANLSISKVIIAIRRRYATAGEFVPG